MQLNDVSIALAKNAPKDQQTQVIKYWKAEQQAQRLNVNSSVNSH